MLANRSLTNADLGIHFTAVTKGGTITANTALGNEVDCKDESTGPLNAWTGNVGVTPSHPPCAAPPTVDDDPGHDGKGHDKKKSKKPKKHRPDPCQCTLPWRF